MNRFVLHIFLFLSAFSLNGQTLVYNGGFEEYSSCPTGNDLNNDQLEKATGWWKPTLGTSDYFNSCATQMVGVPFNFWGYQQPHSGDGYTGLGAVCWYNTTGEYCGFEYIQSKLIEPLKPCFRYRFSMYVSLANQASHGVGRFGALFTIDTSFNNELGVNVIDITPQVFNSSGILNDTTIWKKVEGSFIANGFEKYITIGYFFPNVANDTSFVQIMSGFPNESVAYYYVDDISLYEVEEVSSDFCNPPELILPNVITANGDGINDFIDVRSMLSISPEIRIVNRWGDTVIILDKNNPFWDGADCTEGVYYYIIDYPFGDKIKQQSGFIQLVR